MKRLCFSCLILCCCHSGILSQPIVKVYGNEALDSMKTAIQAYRCLELLDVEENVCICIRFSNKMPKGLHALTFFQNTIGELSGQSTPIYRVRINARYKPTRQVTALAHELVHVKQYVKGELIPVDKQSVIWNNEVYQYLNDADRFVSPWEQEAYGLDNQLAIEVEKNPGQSPLASRQPQ